MLPDRFVLRESVNEVLEGEVAGEDLHEGRLPGTVRAREAIALA